MIPAVEVLYAVASELAQAAKDSLPKLRDGEEICREWYTGDIYYRETEYKGRKYLGQYDFKQRKSRHEAVKGCIPSK